MLPVPPECMPGERKLAGFSAYDAALDELIMRATCSVKIFDKNLGRGFNTPRRAELLGSFLLAGRANRVQIVVHDASNIVRDCPRLMALLKRFSHGIAIHQTLPPARNVYDPFSIADDTRFVRRFHYADPRGVTTLGDITATGLLSKRFNEIWDASAPAVIATTIGL